MIRIKVQYDALTRTFKLIDSQFTTLLEGDALYDLDVPVMVEEDDMGDWDFIPSVSGPVAHA